MKPSAELHELIHSLTPNEKGYFKKHCQRSGSTSRKYLRIFDVIASQKEYDERALKKKLGDPVLVRNLSSEKNYLYHLILEALIAGNTLRDPAHETELLLAKAKWLASHSFYDQASRFIRKVRTWAEENEAFTMHLDVLDLEWLLWQYLPQEERRDIGLITSERHAAIKKLTATDRVRALDVQLIRLFQEIGIGRSQDDLEKYRAIYSESRIVAAEEEPLPVRAKIFLLNISVFYHNVSGDAEKSLDDLRLLITLLSSNAPLKRERLSFYISSLNNLILLLLHLGRYDEARENILLLESASPETQSQRNTVFVTRYNTRFDLYMHTRDWKSSCDLSRELEKELPSFEEKIDNRYTGHIRFAAFRSCFYNGEFKEALHWINQLVQKTPGEPFKTELITIARMCELVIHETLGNYDLLETLVDSASRYLEKTNSLYRFESLMLQFFRGLVRTHVPKNAFSKLKEELNFPGEDELEERVFSYFDFRAWVEARIADKTIADVLMG